jgi:hypothetical protein
MRRATAAQNILCDVFMKHHNDASKTRPHHVKNNSTATIVVPPAGLYEAAAAALGY